MVHTATLLRHTPLPIALLDRELNIQACSEHWQNAFGTDPCKGGLPLSEAIAELPEEIWIDLQYCLEGVENRADSGRFTSPEGKVDWYEWKINSWSSDRGELEGLILILEKVTDRYRKTQLLEKSQEVARIGGWKVNLLENTIYWSTVTREIHEVPEDFEPDLKTGIDFYKEGYSRDTITRVVKEAIASGTPWDEELQIVTAKGREVWVRAKGETEMVNGRCVRIIGTFQDIDQRKRAELEYKMASERLAIATGTAGIGIWEFDPIGNDLFWDSNMYTLYGIDATQFNGVYDAWESCVHPEDKDRTASEVAEAIWGNGDFDTVFRIIWGNGEIRWIKASATVIRDESGQPVKMIGVNEDITELRNTRLQLIQSEESLNGAFEYSRIGMALVGLDGKFKKVNRSLCQSLGYTEEQLLRTDFQSITHPEDLKKDLSLLNEVLRGERETYQIEKRYFHKDGSLVFIFLTVTAVKNIDGQLSHFISQIVDMTSRMEAENKLKSLYDLTAKQNESLLNFAHIVSHNLRSHATNLSMITDFLLTDKIGDAEREKALGMLGKAAAGLNETIEHLNEVVLVKATMNNKLRTLNLSDLLKKVLFDLEAIIRENHTRIEVGLPDNLKVSGVAAYVESILLNMITNAIKYRHPDRENRIRIQAKEQGEFVEICFSDNGQGIDLERHGAKLFGMYKTFHKHKDAKGIGLFITKNQLESMGGSIRVESQVGKGTSFIVQFVKPN